MDSKFVLGSVLYFLVIECEIVDYIDEGGWKGIKELNVRICEEKKLIWYGGVD